ncbi:tetratricopeptide repeat protein [uncultured Alistipes sp.]|uniref:tetratricopeptide repeat protein n=1 Tax=uncultured Alistipes sp. TaxID=538949 RepID=UPI0026037281|nr:tetratricopeptide repeat protein [uncultured Alistipes sp.]
MRRFFLFLLLLAAWGVPSPAGAQLDKAYFFHVGRTFLMDDKYRDAIEVLNILLRVDSTAAEGYFLRGIAKYNLDDLLGAEQDFSLAVARNPVFTTAFQYRAITRMRLGNYDDALKDFQQAIDLRPDRPGPYYSRGVTYLMSQQFEKAIADFDTFIRYDAKVSDAYLNRGTSYLYLKDTTKAYEDYGKAIRTNYYDPAGYNRRGALYMAQKKYDLALADFDKAIGYDSTYAMSYFNRAMVHSHTRRPVQAIEDFSRALALDSTNSLTYFNRALLRSQIGDYNRALEDYDRVAFYSPNNVLVYYNRAGLYARLGDYESAIRDYSRAIELYPDFANAYLGRSSLRYLTRDVAGSRSDKEIAERKIAEYRSKLDDSTFSVYADTSRRFDGLLDFDSDFSGGQYDRVDARNADIALLPLFKFTFMQPDSMPAPNLPGMYYSERAERFRDEVGALRLAWRNVPSDLPPDTLAAIDSEIGERLRRGDDSWQTYFERGLSQSLVRQYTSSLDNYTAAIDRNPSNPFPYINRSTTRSEMIDFISSFDNGYQRVAVEQDPVGRLKNGSERIYNYDEAIADLDRAARLLPDFAYIYYNRANLLCLSGRLPEAIEDYTRAIGLNPSFGEAYYNRGLVQIYLKDTRKGCLDMSKAGELGVSEAYKVLKIYGQPQRK